MFFLNLGLPQLAALFGAISAVSVLLYLLDRSRRRQVVSTLRFWVAAEQPTAVVKRKHIQQPFSLLLQLLAMLLLLLAIAQPRLGNESSLPRHHVIVLDNSAWMAARVNNGTLMDGARNRARAYVRALPLSDRIMLIRADALATPATAFELNRGKLERAISDTQPGSTALNLEQALQFASRVQANGGRPGEIAFIGTGHISQNEPISNIKNLRVLPVADPVENAGLRKIAMQRSTADPDLWDINVAVRNYGTKPRVITLALAMGAVPAGSQRFVLAAGGEKEATFTYRTRAAGVLQARIFPGDAFPADDRAALQVPALPSVPVTVYSNEPDLLRPFLAANPQVTATFRSTAQYQPSDKGLVILDRFRPDTKPTGDTIWLDPPGTNPPAPIKSRVPDPQSVRWTADRTLGGGLRTRDVRIASASVFGSAPGDIKVAEVDAGPIILARPGKPKSVIFGFHPALSAMRYELATPLLFANILRWLSPDSFRIKELSAGPVGTVNLALETDVSPADVKVVKEDGSAIPFTLDHRSLHFFSGSPGIARVSVGDRETVYSMTLPGMWETRWEIPATARRGLPALRDNVRSTRDFWQLLAVLGGLCLLVEWLMFGRLRRAVLKARNMLRWPASLRKAS